MNRHGYRCGCERCRLRVMYSNVLKEVDWEMLRKGTYEIFLEFSGSGDDPAMKVHEFLENLIKEHEERAGDVQ